MPENDQDAPDITVFALSTDLLLLVTHPYGGEYCCLVSELGIAEGKQERALQMSCHYNFLINGSNAHIIYSGVDL